MESLKDRFLRDKLYFKTYLMWKAKDQNIRGFHMKIAKKDLEISRAFLTVERKKGATKWTR